MPKGRKVKKVKKSSKRAGKVSRNSSNNSKKKTGCYKISNPWYSILSSELLKYPFFRTTKISNSQEKNWCNVVKKSKKKGYSCVNLDNGKHDLSKWNSVCY